MDALTYDGVAAQDDWTLEGLLFRFESFNGFGYRQFNNPSPYLFAQTNRWVKGKYVRDSEYDPEAGSSQIGAAAFLRRLLDRKLITIEGQDASDSNSGDSSVPVKPAPISAEFKGHLERLGSQLMKYKTAGLYLSAGSVDTDEEIAATKYLQIAFQDFGEKVEVNGKFGPTMRELVEDFQTEHKLDVDGIVGPATFGKVIAIIDKMAGGETKPPAPAPQPSTSSINAKLFAYYSVRANYNKVYDSVMGWYGTTSNGCIAFMSEALRQVGVAVPKKSGLGGEPISLVTKPFSYYLEHNLGWKRINKASDLLPGDVVFTIDAPRWPSWPAHTYMFHSWADKANGTGRVVDNQAFTHNRNIFGYGSYNFSPFAYALRAPT